MRYVRIDAPKTFLQISQVAVYSAADGSNLALKKTTFASRPGASKDHAANAVSGWATEAPINFLSRLQIFWRLLVCGLGSRAQGG